LCARLGSRARPAAKDLDYSHAPQIAAQSGNNKNNKNRICLESGAEGIDELRPAHSSNCRKSCNVLEHIGDLRCDRELVMSELDAGFSLALFPILLERF